MTWLIADRADPFGRQLADRHYTRQSVGAAQFVPPGRCLVLTTVGALWVSSWPLAEFVRHEWAGAWICSMFRNERPDLHLSSDLIVAAVAATRWRWPATPDLGMVTFVDAERTRHKRDPGRCFRRAGFVPVGHTKGGLVALHHPAVAGLGISVDEIERARPGIDPKAVYQRRVYPLLDLGLDRKTCQRVIADAGLPVPPKSACFFCPLHDREAWRAQKRDTSELFKRSCQLEATLNERRDALGKDHVFLTRHGRPLSEVVDDQLQFDGMDNGCDSGWCFS